MALSLANVTNLYILSTLILFSYSFLQIYKKADNYFSAALIYLDDTLTNFIFYNMIFSLGVLWYKLCICLFFVDVKQNETIKMVDKLKAKIIDVFLFCYILEGQIQINSFICIMFIFFTYVIHEMAILRADYLTNTPVSLSLNLNYRLSILFVILGFVDFEILKYSIDLLYSEKSTYFIFVYYQILISLGLINPMIKYWIDFYQKYTLSHVHNKDQNLALLNLIISVPKLLIQICLAICLAVKFNIFFYLIFTVIELISELSNTIKSYNRIKKLTDTMKNLKKIDEDEIKKHHDNTCMVCFQDMTEAMLLPCKHFFHEDCLKQWIIKNSNHFCPKCKKQFNFDNKNVDQNNVQNNQNNEKNKNQREQRDKINKRRKKYMMSFTERMRQKLKLKQKQKIQKIKMKRETQKDQEKQEKLEMRKQLNQNQEQNQKQEEPFIKQFNQKKIEQKKEEKTLIKQKQHKKRKHHQHYHEYEHQNQVIQKDSIHYKTMYPWYTPLELVQKQKQRHFRVGSLPFGLPTQAVYDRRVRHMYVRERYELTNNNLIKEMGLKENQLLLILDDI